MIQPDNRFDTCSMCGDYSICFDVCVSMHSDGNFQSMCQSCTRKMTLQYQQKIQELEEDIEDLQYEAMGEDL